MRVLQVVVGRLGVMEGEGVVVLVIMTVCSTDELRLMVEGVSG